MLDEAERAERAVSTLYRQAVRGPLLDSDAERDFYEQMMRIADGRDEQADLLADPDLPLSRALEFQVEHTRVGIEHHLGVLAGEDYEDVAIAYLDGERDDWIGELAVYYRECLLRLEETALVDHQTFVLLVLRYRDCFTVNFSFAEGDLPETATYFESPTHAGVDYDDAYGERYYAESQRARREAATYLRETADVVREQFPDPETSTLDERAYSGFVYLTGRRGDVFADVLEPVAPDPDRFDTTPAVPGLVPEGPEAERVERDYLADAEIVA